MLGIILFYLPSLLRGVALVAKTDRRGDAEIGFAEIERRLQKIAPPLRAEARVWRDLAARALGRS